MRIEYNSLSINIVQLSTYSKNKFTVHNTHPRETNKKETTDDVLGTCSVGRKKT